MKAVLIFLLILSLVALVLSHTVGRSIDDKHSSSNKLDSDLPKKNSETAESSARVMNKQTAVAEVDNKLLSIVSNGIIATFFLPISTFLGTLLMKSKLTLIHLLFGVIFGIVSTIATCNSTALCNISAGPSLLSMEPIMDYMTIDNVQSVVQTAVRTYQAVGSLS